MDAKANKNMIVLGLAIFVGIGLRMWAMSIGSTFDFESYCIVGKLVNEGKNVYAGTTRYNYGPIFFLIQGLCYTMAKLLTNDIILTYRVLIVLVMTLADLGIMFFLINKRSIGVGILFFLNPVSIIISGFHNQFDNIAILLILCSIFFYNEEQEITKSDLLFVLFVALSLTTKHVLFVLPVWLFSKNGLSLKKRLLYSGGPLFLFGVSFLPFMGSIEAIKGIIYNVFLYRANAYGSLWRYVEKIFGLPLGFHFPLFILCMIIIGLLVRNQKYEYQIMIYLIAQIVFSSAGAQQYLVIPLVAVCMLDNKICRNLYFLMAGLHLFVGEFSIISRIDNELAIKFCEWILSYGYEISLLVLLMGLCRELICKKREQTKKQVMWK